LKGKNVVQGENDKLRYIPELDGLRGIAVLFVLFGHMPVVDIPYLGNFISDINHFFYLPFMGVDIFFCLSGFLITRIILAKKKAGTFSFVVFWLKRAIRIFPVYYLVLFAVAIFITTEHFQPLALYYANYTFSIDKVPHPMRHAWSLAVEEHYYLFLPSIILLVKQSNLVKYLFGAVTLIFFYLLLCGAKAYDQIDKVSHVRFLTLIFGSLLALKEENLRRMSGNLIKKIGLTVIFIFLFMPLIRFLNYPVAVAIGRVVGYALFSGCLIAVVVHCSDSGNLSLFRGVLLQKRLSQIGRISYGVYLYHLPILFLFQVSHMQDNEPVPFWKYILLLFLIFGISHLSFKYIESPLLRLKKKIEALR
jgi:peptidoglycan/LPS O-acetylase OafA/YrhL